MWDMPEKLYKYRSTSSKGALERLLDIVQNSQIYLSSPKDFNDPFDCVPPVRCVLSDEEFANYLVAEMRRRYPQYSTEQIQHHLHHVIGNGELDPRQEPLASIAQKQVRDELFYCLGVFCASEKNNDVLMWAHYADSHRGVCLEFNGNSGIMRLAKKVNYSEMRPTIRLLDKVGKGSSQVIEATLAKSPHWAYEKEWRIVHPEPGPMPFDPDDLTGIIFGAAASEEIIHAVSEAAKRSPSKLRLYRSVPDPVHYDYLIEPVAF